MTASYFRLALHDLGAASKPKTATVRTALDKGKKQKREELLPSARRIDGQGKRRQGKKREEATKASMAEDEAALNVAKAEAAVAQAVELRAKADLKVARALLAREKAMTKAGR